MYTIKGVNKHVIEVANPDNECFEKVIIFLSPNMLTIDRNDILKKANDYIDNMINESNLPLPLLNKKKKRISFLGILKILAPLALGILVSMLFFK